eukprot:g6133.t1
MTKTKVKSLPPTVSLCPPPLPPKPKKVEENEELYINDSDLDITRKKKLLSYVKELRENIDTLHHNSTPVRSNIVSRRLNKLRVEELCKNKSWKPPPLYKNVQETQLGPIDRYTLVECVCRSTNGEGRELTNDELTYITLLMEQSEIYLSTGRFDIARTAFLDVINRCPSFTLAYYKAALSSIAVDACRGRGKKFKSIRESANRLTNPFSISVDDEGIRLLRCCVSLEPKNMLLRRQIDFILKIVSGASTIGHKRDERLPLWQYQWSIGDTEVLLCIARLSGAVIEGKVNELRKVMRQKRLQKFDKRSKE